MRNDTPVTTYGVKEHRNARDAADLHKEELELRGFTTIDSGLGEDEIVSLKGRLERLHEKQIELAGGVGSMDRIGEANTVRAPLVYDDTFLKVATNPVLLALVGRMLGDFYLLMQQNGILVQPDLAGHRQASFHRDLPYQHFVCTRPIAVNALLCLDTFTEENGGTIVIPGSHRMEAFPSESTVRRMAQSLNATPGQFLVVDCMVYHCAGTNRTSSPRRAINNVYTLPFVRQQISLPDALRGRHSSDPTLRRLLGYDTVAPTSVEGWYAQRKSRT